jgi:hypothetical protein
MMQTGSTEVHSLVVHPLLDLRNELIRPHQQKVKQEMW